MMLPKEIDRSACAGNESDYGNQKRIDKISADLMNHVRVSLQEIKTLGGEDQAVKIANETVLECAKMIGYT